ncbi:MAG: hypothetical protein K8I29_05980 [Alphaproteobacteria bacterium]|uniref:Uncharacterized protein n=1 Tax=Candidatus Nitrobium versatile TaxID=2884831 RepID=A0A953JDH8_9BACT|nr:hypothetical protein [Candidatus Nitrobium versatile]
MYALWAGRLQRAVAAAFYFIGKLFLLNFAFGVVTATRVVGLYPPLISSSLDPNCSLTVFTSSLSHLSLGNHDGDGPAVLPVVIASRLWIFRIFRNKVTEEEILKDKEAF